MIELLFRKIVMTFGAVLLLLFLGAGLARADAEMEKLLSLMAITYQPNEYELTVAVDSTEIADTNEAAGNMGTCRRLAAVKIVHKESGHDFGRVYCQAEGRGERWFPTAVQVEIDERLIAKIDVLKPDMPEAKRKKLGEMMSIYYPDQRDKLQEKGWLNKE